MRRTYPYLRDPYKQTMSGEKEKMNFLATLDNFVNQRQYVRLTLLNWQEEPIKEIQGEITSGSISKDGSSAVRTTCNLACSVNYGDYDVQILENDFSINKKIFVEIGVKNDSDEYPEYPILWFPQGVFYIASCGCNSSVTGAVNLTLSLKDKMAGLNGELGGKFPVTTQLDIVETQLPNGQYKKQKVLIYNIIQEMVNHYGNEDLNNIVIEDVPIRIRRVVKWNGENDLYMVQTADPSDESNTDTAASYYFTVDKDPSWTEDNTPYTTFATGDDVGYVFDDFVYTKELTINGGGTVVQALDQIKNWLGNYEYFYDEFGVFHFREIKNYLNTTQGKLVLDEVSENQYMVGNDNSKSIYTFSSNNNIISINATPDFSNIRNDFVVTGLRKNSGDKGSMVMYHLAIEDKPELHYDLDNSNNRIYYYGKYGSTEEMLIFYEQEETGYTVAAVVTPEQWGLPEVGNNNLIYYDTLAATFYRWDDEALVYKKIGFPVKSESSSTNITGDDAAAPIEADENNIKPPIVYTTSQMYPNAAGKIYYATDWRTHLYLLGCRNSVLGLDTGHYYQELAAYWPQVYDLVNKRFYGEALEDGTNSEDAFGNTVNIHNEWRTLTEGNYYLDFINASTASIGKYGVDTIGRRPEVYYKEDINCLFQPEIPDVNFLNIEEIVYNASENTGSPSVSTIEAQRKEADENGYPYTQVTNEIYENLTTGGLHVGAFDEIKYQLMLHTYYARVISLTALPAYHLQPNSRVTIEEDSTNTYGDFIIKSINFALGPSGTMTVSLNEATEKF